MPTTKNPGTRYRLIDECLQRRHKAWPVKELRATVATKFFELTGYKLSQRQFAQDIADMREGGSTGYNAPIEWNRERGYHYADSEFSIHNSPLVSNDAGVLRQALAMLQQFQGLGLGDELHELTQRVEGHLQAHVETEQQLILFEQVPNYIGTQFLGPLYQVIRKQQVLKMQYRPFSAEEPLSIIVHPYLLKQYNRRWFLIGQGTGRIGLSTYALDRIENFTLCSNQAYVSIPNDIASRFANIVGVSIPSEDCVPELVQLLFSSNRGQYVRTKPIHSTQQIQERANGVLEVSLNVIPTQELVTLLLSFGDDVEVVAPSGLRDQIKEHLRAAAMQYI